MNKMEFAGVINSEETISGLLPDGRRIFVQILSVYPMPTPGQRTDPLYWLERFERGDFADTIAWVEPTQDPDGLDKQGQQAWRAFERDQALELSYEERERQADFERLAYCGWEEF